MEKRVAPFQNNLHKITIDLLRFFGFDLTGDTNIGFCGQNYQTLCEIDQSLAYSSAYFEPQLVLNKVANSSLNSILPLLDYTSRLTRPNRRNDNSYP